MDTTYLRFKKIALASYWFLSFWLGLNLNSHLLFYYFQYLFIKGNFFCIYRTSGWIFILNMFGIYCLSHPSFYWSGCFRHLCFNLLVSFQTCYSFRFFCLPFYFLLLLPYNILHFQFHLNCWYFWDCCPIRPPKITLFEQSQFH